MTTKKKLLLAACCGPCATHAIEELSRQYSVTVHFWGSNIHPRDEYEKRLEALGQVCAAYDCPLVAHPYNDTEFIDNVKGLENEREGGARCTRCFELRLRTGIEYAIINDIPYVATSLTVSPHKNAEQINQLGSHLTKELSNPGRFIKYLATDFKANGGFGKSVELSKKIRIYRQNYCGCKFSK